MYSKLINEIKAQRESLRAEIKKMEEASALLRSHRLETAAMDVEEKTRAMLVEHNNLCDDIESLKKQENHQRAFNRKLKNIAAMEEGVLSFWEAVDNQTYVAKCPYRAKDLKASWLKGVKQAENAAGYYIQIQSA